MTDVISLSKPALSEIDFHSFSELGIQASILRLDLLHPHLSGNKWFKLKYNLEQALADNAKTLVSFGGVWSNHIHALAWAGQKYGFKTVGYIRGMGESLTPCLEDALKWGMRLVSLDREAYKRRHEAEFTEGLLKGLDAPFLIPEGGGNALGIKGCAEILDGLDQDQFDHTCLACGTGTTMAGLLSSARVPVTGIQVLKGDNYLSREVSQLVENNEINPIAPWSVDHRFHRGGYAKADEALLSFCADFGAQTGVPLEPVYTGKLVIGVLELAREGYFAKGSRVLLIHGGGLQGNRGYLNKNI